MLKLEELGQTEKEKNISNDSNLDLNYNNFYTLSKVQSEKIEKEFIHESRVFSDKAEREKLVNEGELIDWNEKTSDGLPSFQVFKFYAKNCGYINLTFIIFLYIITISLKIFLDFWVSCWMKNSLNYDNKNNYGIIYLGLLLTSICLIIFMARFFRLHILEFKF